MTQAYNLSQLANFINSSGKLSNTGLQNPSVTVSAGTGLSGGGSVNLGSTITLTNTGLLSASGSGSGISVSTTSGAVTIQNTGVTSVNGSTGAITNSARPGSASWHTVTGSRALNNVYTNSNSYEIVVNVCVSTVGGTTSIGYVSGVQLSEIYTPNTNGVWFHVLTVPSGATYEVTQSGGGSLSTWAELY